MSKSSLCFISLIILLFSLSNLHIHAQGVKNIDGLYYTDNNELYTGDYIELNENGGIKIKTHILNGQKDGETTIFFPDGQINETRCYHKGKKHGEWISYDTTGVKIAVATYENNVKSGKWLIWDAQGTLRYEMFYDKGQKTGVWKMWDEQGILIEERKY